MREDGNQKAILFMDGRIDAGMILSNCKCSMALRASSTIFQAQFMSKRHVPKQTCEVHPRRCLKYQKFDHPRSNCVGAQWAALTDCYMYKFESRVLKLSTAPRRKLKDGRLGTDWKSRVYVLEYLCCLSFHSLAAGPCFNYFNQDQLGQILCCHLEAHLLFMWLLPTWVCCITICRISSWTSMLYKDDHPLLGDVILSLPPGTGNTSL